MKVNVFDGNVFFGVLEKMVKARAALPRLNEVYKTRVQNGLDNIAKTAVEDFYNSYKGGPHIYHRKGDLKNAYNITVTDDEWDIEVGPQFMQHDHNQGNEYVYNLTMNLGIHGGSPHNGDYYWRIPVPDFTDWYPTPAVRGPEGTEERIKQESDEFIDTMYQDFSKNLNNILDDILDELNKIL